MIRTLAIALAIILSGIFDQAAIAADARLASSVPPSLGGEDALRQVAALAIERTVDHLGTAGGFYLVPKFHIPLPGDLNRPVDALDRNFAPTYYVAVEKAINRAAEALAPKAGDFLLKSLPNLKFADPRKVLRGPNDAVTAELKSQIGPAFRDTMRPLLEANLVDVGAQAALGKMQARYEEIAAGPFQNFDVRAHTLDRFVSAFFLSLAEEERNIRLHPTDRPTETLKRLFSRE
jgi:hypothetical protein